MFNIYGEYIIKKSLEYWDGCVRIRGRRITILRLADNVALCAGSEMREILDTVKKEMEALDLMMNIDKTKIMLMDRALLFQLIMHCKSSKEFTKTYQKIKKTHEHSNLLVSFQTCYID